MAWGSPRTWTTGEIVTGTILNTVRDDFLELMPAKVTTAGDLLVGAGANSGSRLAVGATGSFLRSTDAGTGAVWQALDDILPWLIDVDPMGGRHATTGVWSISRSASVWMGGLLSSAGVQNSDVSWDLVLAAGTWAFSMEHLKGSGVGIYTVTIGGVSAGTIDGYAAGTAVGKDALTGFSVATTGKKRLTLQMATKNASSSGYTGQVAAINLLRTA